MHYLGSCRGARLRALLAFPGSAARHDPGAVPAGPKGSRGSPASRPPAQNPRRVRNPAAAAELLRPPARRAHDFGRSPSARTDGTALVSRCLRVGGVPCECVGWGGAGAKCVCVCAPIPAPVTPPLLAVYREEIGDRYKLARHWFIPKTRHTSCVMLLFMLFMQLARSTLVYP